MLKLVDRPHSKCGVERRVGSSPTSGTIQIRVMNVKEVAEHYGKERQLVKLAEECCELAVECFSVGKKGHTVDMLAEEIADVRIMLDQITHLYGCADLVEYTYQQKVQRESDRIQNKVDPNTSEMLSVFRK